MHKPIKTAQDAYNTVEKFLRNYPSDDSDVAFEYCKANGMEAKLGKYGVCLDMIVRVYYNIEDFVADGEPMDKVWTYIEMCAA